MVEIYKLFRSFELGIVETRELSNALEGVSLLPQDG